MNLQLELQVYQRSVKYLSGGSNLPEFRQWFDRSTWNERPWTSALIGSVELAIAEYLNGDRTEAELKAAFSDAISNVTLYIPVPSAVTVVTESDSVVKATPTWGATVTILGLPSGQLRATEFA